MKFLKEIFKLFLESRTFEKGAALSYYVAFSFLPMIVIVVSVLGIIFKEDTVSGELNQQLETYMGHQAALQFEKLIRNQHENHNSLLTTILGFATLAFASTAGFKQLQRSLNDIWGIKDKPKSGILKYIINHLTSFAILIILGFILILSTTLSSLLYKFSENLPDFLANVHLYEKLVSILVVTLTLIVLFKFLGNARVPWKNVLASALFTSILFFLGKEAIILYIAHSNLTTTFGAASVIALLMIWVYYTSQILYLGACFAYVFGTRFKCEITPDAQAVRVIEKEVQ